MAVTKQDVFRGVSRTYYNAKFYFRTGKTCSEAKQLVYFACTAGHPDCRVVAWTSSRCIAGARQAFRHGNGYGYAIADNTTIANGMAVQNCRNAGNAECRPSVWQCASN